MKLLKFTFLFISLFSLMNCVSILPINQNNKNSKKNSVVKIDSINKSEYKGQMLSNKTMVTGNKLKVVAEINTKLEIYLIEIENKIANQEISNAEVSKANVGWHIEHVLLTIDKIIDS